jgi:hypothetical protein
MKKCEVAYLESFCTPVHQSEFLADGQGDYMFKRFDPPINFRAPIFDFNSPADFSLGSGFGESIQIWPFVPRNFNRKDSFVVHLQDASIIPQVFCILNSKDQIVFPNSYGDESPDYLTLYSERSSLMQTRRRIRAKDEIVTEHYVRADLPEVVVSEPCVLVSSQSSINIYHWLIESVTRLWIFDLWPELKSCKFIVHDVSDPKVLLLHEKFGIPLENIIGLAQPIRYRFNHLIFPSALADLSNSREKLDFLRNTFGVPPQDKAPEITRPRRFYTSRKDTPMGRGIENESALLDALAPFGVEELVMSRYSLDELATMFTSCDLLVGPMGSGLINMIYMPPNSAVVELCTRSWDGLFWSMGCGAGHRWYAVASEWDTYISHAGKGFTYGMPDSMEFDPQRVARMVERSLADSGKLAK